MSASLAMRRIALVTALLGTLLVLVSFPSTGSASTRLTGTDNVATAIAWSQHAFDSASTAVLARNDSFADALAAGALAAAVDGPFLVTPTGSLDARVRTELERLGVDDVLVIGGTAAVSDAVVSSLSGYDVTRVAGTNRIETAVRVAERFGSPSTVVLARAFGDGTAGFADSLGGGALAASLGAPLLLTETGAVSDATMAFLDDAGVDDVLVVGGTAAVSDAAVAALQAMGHDVTRLAGTTRYGTAAAVAERAHDGGEVALLDGLDADSWVSGFAAAVLDGGAVLLTAGSELPDETADALRSLTDADLLCAPEVSTATCSSADVVLGGSGDDLVLADGRLRIKAADIGDHDLTALPVGDDRVSRSAASKGSLFLCSTFPIDGGGASSTGPWVHGDTWDLTEKLWVLGEVSWSAAEADVRVVGSDRVLTGNLLPVGHTTGSFPIASTDPAYQYDGNPSAIAANDYEITLPATPTRNASGSCVGGEVGFLLSGVVLNSPVDAMGRDALAWELQDHCQGHPNNAGYHYHSVSTCVADDDGVGHSDLVGYALDGFGIYGVRGEDGQPLSNADLDECHGHTHTITWDGTSRSMYHYHATWEFPYAVGCFRGTSAISGPVLGPQH